MNYEPSTPAEYADATIRLRADRDPHRKIYARALNHWENQGRPKHQDSEAAGFLKVYYEMLIKH